jgi:23S rRNA (guanine745-N1)-methyltransferase
VVCAKGHSFDVARSGYVNLLQPQDRRSLDAGDSKEAVAARARLAAAGVGSALIDACVRHVHGIPCDGREPVIVELGSGTGDLLAAVANDRPAKAVGIDLSVAAADWAARHHPGLTWVVANADRALPLLDASADVVLSIHARRNPAECARILRPGGHLLVAVPAPDDLKELRASIQGVAAARDRVAAVIEAHRDFFTVMAQTSASEERQLEPAVLRDLLRGTYRGARASTAARVDNLSAMPVTLASEIVLLARI